MSNSSAQTQMTNIKEYSDRYSNLGPVQALLETVRKLRSPEGCPWDKEQTHQSLKKYLIEEAYEVLEAIDKDSTKDLAEELGDLLFQICIHSEIESEKGTFDFFDVANALNEKMISRHPHVFGETVLESSGQVVEQWEKIKAHEKPERATSPFSGIPKELPSLLRALKVLKKADKLGMSVQTKQPDLKTEISFSNEEELGQLLLGIVNFAKAQKLDPEEALRQAVNKIQQACETKVNQN
ncbi:MAG: nucleoside triphosphate pyrophosphohydrolase [Candidatus Caenarcaniphilales bacterium]|nr:nucleoside triphosphate pyrophosphohydrolase [Candidatus Caenarcaniphilales bacterium]